MPANAVIAVEVSWTTEHLDIDYLGFVPETSCDNWNTLSNVWLCHGCWHFWKRYGEFKIGYGRPSSKGRLDCIFGFFNFVF